MPERWRIRPEQLPTLAVALLATAYFALWACAPAATLAPQLYNGAERRSEVAVAATYSSALDGRASSLFVGGCPHAVDGQISWSRQLGHWDVGATAFGGTGSAVGAGGFGRYRVVDTPRGQVGVQFAGGWLWAALAVPMSVAVTDQVWIYTAPNFGYQLGFLRLPLGIAIRIEDAISLYLEGGFRTNSIAPTSSSPVGSAIENAVSGSAGVGFRF